MRDARRSNPIELRDHDSMTIVEHREDVQNEFDFDFDLVSFLNDGMEMNDRVEMQFKEIHLYSSGSVYGKST